MREAYAQGSVGDDFAQSGGDGEAGGFVAAGTTCGGGVAGLLGREGDVEVTFDELQVWGEGAQEGVDGGGGKVAEAEDLADLAGCEEFLELRRMICQWCCEMPAILDAVGTFAGMS